MKRIWRAFIYSLHGLLTAWRNEMAFKQEVILTLILTPVAFKLAPDRLSLVLMLGSLLLVLIVELVNTAVEATVDRIGEKIHPLSKKAKDTASAAVLIALLLAATTWLAILF